MGDRELGSLRSLAHPVRLQILSLLTPCAMNATEVARELGVTHANASYHLRVLAAAGELVLESEEKIRGGTAKRYRHLWDAPHPEPRSSHVSSENHVRALASELVRRHGLRRPGLPGLMTDADLWVTPQVWAEVIGAVRQAAERLHAEAQPPRSDGSVHVNLSAAAFEMQP